MRILLTGGAGFIGSHIAQAALACGWDVTVLDSLEPAVHPRLSDIDPRLRFLKGDVGDRETVAVALDGADVVVHQSAKVGLGVDFSDAPDYVRNNDLATAVLLAGMAEAGIGALVLASSMVVYGEGAYTSVGGQLVRPGPRRASDLAAGIFDPRHPETGELLTPALLDEDARLDPRNVYAASKLAQEHLASAWARSTGGRAIALRYHNVYGPRMPKNTPYAGVASLFRSALSRGEAPRVFEDGGQRRSFIHVADVAAANISAVQALQAGNGRQFRAFNVGANEVHTVGDVARALSEAAGGPPPVVTGEFRLGDVRHITASSDRIKSELGWAPQRGFEDGMKEFALAPLRGESQVSNS
ncbi:NAD-dependent epimerase/dehydratase family protein [Paenarthrobacter sp. Z7-10]|uniref:NAD-dependent epimerase/dehydratase family protein n=1 Tax=Paenarthrobacter sp. Z7-10 TaxID=2787635 RepID=UPI0022A8D360|nr:NAD-dependent epimerase/dehydratase family protein [Paenarthrobacter sp. Z7-10]MCZ2403583.1 NAD-dependent epimerase/dehydratase family protein [Paenarthrobacter sp. Z7-10]